MNGERLNDLFAAAVSTPKEEKTLVGSQLQGAKKSLKKGPSHSEEQTETPAPINEYQDDGE